MILSKDNWSDRLEFNLETTRCLVVKELDYFYQLYRELLKQNDGEEGTFNIILDDKVLNFETEVLVIYNILTISLNSKKINNYIYKEIVKSVTHSNEFDRVNKIKNDITNLLDDIKKMTLINIEYQDSDIELEDFLKLFGVRLSENIDSPAMLFMKYLEVLFEFSKVKVIFIPFMLYLFSKEQALDIIRFCHQNNKIVILLEKEFKKEDFDGIINPVYIDRDIIIT